MKSKLPPIDIKEEKEKYEALYESKEVKFDKCSHQGVRFVDNQLVCTCGAAWSGTRLQELFDLFTGKK